MPSKIDLVDDEAAAERVDSVETEAVAYPASDGEAESGETDGHGDASISGDGPETSGPRTTRRLTSAFAFGVLPVLALMLALAAGYLKWQDGSLRDSQIARVESVQAAKDGTVALLSYQPDSVEKDLGAARERLTGQFRDAYSSLANDVVIPGAKQKNISAVASVRAAASVTADATRAIVLVFVNQTTIVGTNAPTDSASAVRVTLDNVGDRWLISAFDPV